MSFDKDYPNRKDWREPYYDSRAVDPTCRNHGSCGYCISNRTHKNRQRANEAQEYLDNYKKYGYDEDDNLDYDDDNFKDENYEEYQKWLANNQ